MPKTKAASLEQRLKLPALTAVLLVASLLPLLIFQFSYNRAMSQLNGAGSQRINLYLSQIRDSFGLKQQYVINLLRNDTNIVNFARNPKQPQFQRQAMALLENLSNRDKNEIIAVASGDTLLLSPDLGDSINNDLTDSIGLLKNNAYRGKNSYAFSLAGEGNQPFYLFGSPINDQDTQNPIGVAAVLVALDGIQQRLADEWSLNDEIFFVSDSYGLIILSSEQQLLYKSINDLPYAVKQELLARRGIKTDTSSRLSIATAQSDDGLVTVSNLNLRSKDVDTVYLANSVLLPEYRLRVHHLVSATEIQNLSIVYALASLILIAALYFLWLFQRANLAASKLALRNQKILAMSAAHKQQIINATDSGLLCFYSGGEVESMNLACRTLFGFEQSSSGQLLAQLLMDSHLIDDIENDAPHLILTRAKELVARGINGHEFPATISISLMEQQDPKLYLLTITDISQQKQNEALLRNNQKMVAMGMVSATVAHEINQPLTAIKTEAAIATKLLQTEQGDEVPASLLTISQFADTIAKTTGQLRAYARQEQYDPQARAQLYQVIQHVHVMFKHRLQDEGISWQEDLGSTKHWLKIEEHQLQQVVTNLVQNACDAMQGLERKALEINVSVLDENLTLRISDTGPGINPEQQKNIFQAFYSTKLKQQGLGLGLAICSDIISRANGSITVDSNGTGACFILTLPMV